MSCNLKRSMSSSPTQVAKRAEKFQEMNATEDMMNTAAGRCDMQHEWLNDRKNKKMADNLKMTTTLTEAAHGLPTLINNMSLELIGKIHKAKRIFRVAI